MQQLAFSDCININECIGSISQCFKCFGVSRVHTGRVPVFIFSKDESQRSKDSTCASSSFVAFIMNSKYLEEENIKS